MKNKMLSIVSAAMMLVGIASVNAECKEGPYVSATGSFVFSQKDLKESTSKTKESLSASFKSGFGGSIAVGYIVDEWRVELETLYRKNKIKNNKITDANAVEYKYADAHSRDIAVMANVYYDICLDECMPGFKAYVGAGLGVTSTKETYKNGAQINVPTEKIDNAKSSGKHFAWQGLAGFSKDITDNVTAFVGYRLFMHTKNKNAKHLPMSHSIDLGLRYTF